MDLGSFSISLNVKDLAASRSFYEAIGFEKLDGDDESWLVMASGQAKIGLFHQMFETNIITFNPPDARAVEAALQAAGHEFLATTEGTDGPAHCLLLDPDGNTVMFDQHE